MRKSLTRLLALLLTVATLFSISGFTVIADNISDGEDLADSGTIAVKVGE